MRVNIGWGVVFCAVTAGVPAGAQPKPDASVTQQAAKDAGPAETAAQRAFRVEYTNRTRKHEAEITQGHVWTPDIGALENLHWKRAYKALRIRELAEDDKEAAVVKRTDAFLAKLDKNFYDKLEALAKEAPAVQPPPAISAPAKDAKVALGQPLSIKVAPVAGATHYYVVFWTKGHSWSNYDPAKKQFGTTPEITIPPTDPKWSTFSAGKGWIQVRAELPEKTKKGVAYNAWTKTATVPVTFEAGAK